jgi:hypothetical protein
MAAVILTRSISFAIIVVIANAMMRAEAANYPVSGTWTYDNPSGEGPAKTCGSRTMEFRGEQRFDRGGGVPGYRNLSVSRAGPDSFSIVDQFATGQITARSAYTLRKIDGDHIELQMQAGGKTIRLRRCE